MNALEINGLCKSFKGFKLDSINLALPSGCILGLIGENGAGKSTTIALILGLLRKDAGTIHILDREEGEYLPELKEQIGVVLDEVGLPDCVNARQVEKIMRASFRAWNDAAYADYLERLDIPVDKPFKDLSRGNKMKLGIAVALSHNPKLLILDEATSGLDPVAREQVVEILTDFTRDEGHSVLISSHIVSDLEKICDYIAFLHKGKLLMFEEKDQMLARYGIISCSAEEFTKISSEAVYSKRETAFGVQALVRRDLISPEMTVGPVNIEELFVSVVKEAD